VLRKIRKMVVLVLALSMLLSVSIPAMGADAIAVKVDGKKIELDVAPVIEKSRTLIPIRAVVEELGGNVIFNASTQAISINTADQEVKLTLNSKQALVNGASQELEVPAKAVDGRTLVPLRFVGEALGADVAYDAASKTVNVKYFSNMSGTLKIGGSTTIQPLAQAAADKLMAGNQGLSITIAGGGSGEGIKGVHAGTFNIGNVSRDLEAADNVSYPGLISHRIGTDGIAVIVNPKNTVENLTKQQVIDIFTGKIKNWKELGGKDAAIFVQTREAGSGTLTAFEELALLKKSKVLATATPHTSTGLIKEAVARNENAIGFISLGYMDNSVKAPKVEGVSALKSKALSKEWPYVRSLVIVSKGTPSGLTAKYVNYLLSPMGQQIVSQDYLPLKVVD